MRRFGFLEAQRFGSGVAFGFCVRGFSALVQLLVFCVRYVFARLKVFGRTAAAAQRFQQQHNKALHPTAYSSVPCARKLASVSSLPAAGELVVLSLRAAWLEA